MTESQEQPPIDPEVATVLAAFADVMIPLTSPADIPKLRAMVPPWVDDLTLGGTYARTDYLLPGVEGKQGLPIAVHAPVDASAPTPVLLHIHGGGLITGGLDNDMRSMIPFASSLGCAVVSVDYRLAPEHPYPAALDDCLTVLRWVAGPDAPSHLDSARLVVSGISAGGGLAAATALWARDHGGPAIAALLLMCPMLDHKNDSYSARQMTTPGSWDRRANAIGWDAYLGDVDPAEVVAYASPARAATLKGLPPTFIDVGSAETFRDECVDFAAAIWREGGDAELHVWPGGTHGFDFVAPEAQMSTAARAARTAWLSRVISRM